MPLEFTVHGSTVGSKLLCDDMALEDSKEQLRKGILHFQQLWTQARVARMHSEARISINAGLSRRHLSLKGCRRNPLFLSDFCVKLSFGF